jgi:hypothetical protein
MTLRRGHKHGPKSWKSAETCVRGGPKAKKWEMGRGRQTAISYNHPAADCKMNRTASGMKICAVESSPCAKQSTKLLLVEQ